MQESYFFAPKSKQKALGLRIRVGGAVLGLVCNGELRPRPHEENVRSVNNSKIPVSSFVFSHIPPSS